MSFLSRIASAANSIGSGEIVDLSIVNADISASAAIVGSKLDLSTPGIIGATTAAAGSFTSLISSSHVLTDTATENDTDCMEIICDAAGFGDVKALDVDYITGATAAGSADAILLVNIDESLATGGEIAALEVLSTTEGTDAVQAMKVGLGIDVLKQEVGTFGNMDSALNKAVDMLAAVSAGGAGNISIFVADDDSITIGDAASFGELEIILDTGASGGGISPTFEYSTGVDAWTAFVPVDGTNGFRNTGAILWDVADLTGFAVGTGTEFLIRITRTKNALATTPIVDKIQIASLTEYGWDKNAALTVASINIGASGDPKIVFDINGTDEWNIGVDDDDSDKFKIGTGSSVGGNASVEIDSNGAVYLPLQPGFHSRLTSTSSNVTGDGTEYSVAFDTETVDRAGNFASNTYTASADGLHLLKVGLRIAGIVSGHTDTLVKIITSNRTYQYNIGDIFAMSASGAYSVNITELADMESGDTAYITLTVSNGTKVIDIQGNPTDGRSVFSGFLLG